MSGHKARFTPQKYESRDILQKKKQGNLCKMWQKARSRKQSYVRGMRRRTEA